MSQTSPAKKRRRSKPLLKKYQNAAEESLPNLVQRIRDSGFAGWIIVTHRGWHDDEARAIWMIIKFLLHLFAGIGNFRLVTLAEMPRDGNESDPEWWLQYRVLLVGIGEGRFDEKGKPRGKRGERLWSCIRLVGEEIGADGKKLRENPALRYMIAEGHFKDAHDNSDFIRGKGLGLHPLTISKMVDHMHRQGMDDQQILRTVFRVYDAMHWFELHGGKADRLTPDLIESLPAERDGHAIDTIVLPGNRPRQANGWRGGFTFDELVASMALLKKFPRAKVAFASRVALEKNPTETWERYGYLPVHAGPNCRFRPGSGQPQMVAREVFRQYDGDVLTKSQPWGRLLRFVAAVNKVPTLCPKGQPLETWQRSHEKEGADVDHRQRYDLAHIALMMHLRHPPEVVWEDMRLLTQVHLTHEGQLYHAASQVAANPAQTEIVGTEMLRLKGKPDWRRVAIVYQAEDAVNPYVHDWLRMKARRRNGNGHRMTAPNHPEVSVTIQLITASGDEHAGTPLRQRPIVGFQIMTGDDTDLRDVNRALQIREQVLQQQAGLIGRLMVTDPAELDVEGKPANRTSGGGIRWQSSIYCFNPRGVRVVAIFNSSLNISSTTTLIPADEIVALTLWALNPNRYHENAAMAKWCRGNDVEVPQVARAPSVTNWGPGKVPCDGCPFGPYLNRRCLDRRAWYEHQTRRRQPQAREPVNLGEVYAQLLGDAPKN